MTDAFYLANGQAVHTIKELLEVLRSMSPQDFLQHVNNERNDFAAWIRGTHKHEKLADLVDRVRSKEILIHVLEAFTQEQERLQREQARTATAPAPHAAPAAPAKPGVDEFFKEPSLPPQTAPASKAPAQHGQQAQAPAQRPAPRPAQSIPRTRPAQSPSPPPRPPREEHRPPESGPESKGEERLSEEEAQRFREKLEELRREINKVFIGQDDVVTKVLLTLVCEAHSLLEGVPGLAKSLLVETLSKVIGGTTFHRIQFLPDMLPADIIGGQIYNPNTGDFSTVKGPIFANFILADEINRAPPKTHAALMEVMQEKKVNIDKIEYPLDRPFMVLATQNPLENKGTYALPEAVLDRFMFKIDLDYPKRKYELRILTENATTKAGLAKSLRVIIQKDELRRMQQLVKTVFISDKIREYILDILEATRGVNKNIEGIRFVKYGGGPRAGIYLAIGSKARAMQQGRNFVLPEDVNFVLPDILRHRIALNFTGKAHGVSSDRIVEEIISKVSTF